MQGLFGNSLGGLGGRNDFIARFELSAPGPSIIIDLPQNYEHIMFLCSLADNRAATGDNANVTFNNDGGANYTGSSVTQIGGFATGTGLSNFSIRITGASGASFAFNQIWLPYYTRGDRYKVLFSSGLSQDSAPSTGMECGFWKNNSPIQVVTFTPASVTNFNAGSFIDVIGVSYR